MVYNRKLSFHDLGRSIVLSHNPETNELKAEVNCRVYLFKNISVCVFKRFALFDSMEEVMESLRFLQKGATMS